MKYEKELNSLSRLINLLGSLTLILSPIISIGLFVIALFIPYKITSQDSLYNKIFAIISIILAIIFTIAQLIK